MHTAALAIVAARAVVACGGRTGLGDGPGEVDAGGPQAVLDAGCDASATMTLASRPQFTWFGESIAVDDANVYWLEHGQGTQDAGALMRVSKCGGAVVQLAATSNYPSSVVVDADRAYWTSGIAYYPDPGGVTSIPLAGGAPTVLETDDNDDGIAIDAIYVYWIGHGQTVRRAPKAGGPVVTLASGLWPWGSLVVNGTSVLWGNRPAMGWSLASLPLAGGPVTNLASASTGSIGALAIDDTRIYWVDYGPGYGATGAIRSAPLDGGAPSTLASVTGGSTSLAVDATNVYWSDGNMTGQGVIMRMPKTGGAPSTIVSGQEIEPMDLAVDATRIYWLGVTTVMAAPK